MAITKDSKGARRSENTARNWDLLSVGSFAAAALIGLIKTANDVRHQFYQAYVIGYKDRKTVCADIVSDSEKRFIENEKKFVGDGIKGSITTEAYLTEMKTIGNERKTLIAKRLKDRLQVDSIGLWDGWVKGTVQRFNKLGSTDRLNAAVGFAGTATIALGAIAVLKHSSRVLDAINQKIGHQEDNSQGR